MTVMSHYMEGVGSRGLQEAVGRSMITGRGAGPSS